MIRWLYAHVRLWLGLAMRIPYFHALGHLSVGDTITGSTSGDSMIVIYAGNGYLIGREVRRG